MCAVCDEYGVDTCFLASFMHKEYIVDDCCANRHHRPNPKAKDSARAHQYGEIG